MKKFIKIKYALILESLHRYIFDNIYVQTRKTSKKDKVLIFIYNFLIKTMPHFRNYLKKNYKGIRNVQRYS